jgi:WD domain, G-beta repeat
MTIAIDCICGNTFAADTGWAERMVACPVCAAALRVSGAGTQYLDAACFAPGNSPLDCPVLPAGEIRLRVEDRDEIAEVDVETIEDEEEDVGDSYCFLPETGYVAELPCNNPSAGRGFFASLGVIPMKAFASCLAYGPGNRWGLAGQGDDVRILNMKAGEKAGRFCAHQAPVTSVALAPDGRTALSGDADGNLVFWDLASRSVTNWLWRHDGPITALAVAPTGDYAVSGGPGGVTRLWELGDVGRERPLARTAWREEVASVAFSQDGRFLLAAGSEGRIDLWAVATGGYLRSFRGADGPITVVRCADGVVTATAAPMVSRIPSHPEVWRWNADTGKPQRCAAKLGETGCLPRCVTLDRDGRRLVIAGRYSSVPYQCIPIVEARAVLAGMAIDVRDAAGDFFSFLERPPHWASALLPKPRYSLEVWSLSTGRCLHAFPDVQGAIVHLAVSPDNARILAALRGGNVRVFAMPET